MFPFTLLFLALIGYAGFPSSPANGMDIAAALSDEFVADPAPPHKFSAPQQEQEYRSRATLMAFADAGSSDDNALAASGDLDLPVAGDWIEPFLAATDVWSERRATRSARAPPISISA